MENLEVCHTRPVVYNENQDCIEGQAEIDHLHTNLESTAVSWPSFRPRGSLARVLHEKAVQDQYLSRLDKNEWYQCDLSSMPPELALKFVQLGPDKETIKFLEESEQKSDWIFTQIWHAMVKAILGWFMTQTAINGWLQRGSMFVMSQPQLLKLLKVDQNVKYKTLLDLGAGDGKVTAHFANLFDKVYVTEISGNMRSLLQNQGYQLLDIENWHLDQQFDVISCLNLIDRCDLPMDLLDKMRKAVRPTGYIVLAVVLPFSAYVESGLDHKPKQLLPIRGVTFEEQIQNIIEDILIPAGYEVVSWSRVPYLCEGDLQQSYYWLDDAVFVLKTSKSFGGP